MGRPRHGEELKLTVTIRLAPALLAAIDKAAKELSVTRSVLIERTMLASPDILMPVHVGVVDDVTPDRTAHTTEVISVADQPPVTQHRTRPVTRDKTVTQDECPHPRDAQQHHTWGKTCAACGARL